MDLPERRKNGTPCQRQFSTSTRSAIIVSVSESAGTPGDFRYPSYCPRTTCRRSIGRSASKTFDFSSRSGLAASEVGGSIATNPSTWNRWVTTMSRYAPVAS